MFSLLDKNDDGYVSFLELLKFMCAAFTGTSPSTHQLQLTLYACTR
jgi:hypothetical protein